LKLYDLSSEFGKLFASIKKRKVKPMFFLAKYTPYGTKKRLLGRETIIYGEELPDLLALAIAFIVLIIIGGI